MMCSSPSAELTTDANSMIGYLRDLGSDIDRGMVTFTTEELQSLMWLSNVLKQHDNRRIKLHEVLEACTISASVLRHRLGAFPYKVENELSDALHSARCSDAAQIETLQLQCFHLLASGKTSIEAEEVRLSELITASSTVDKKKDVLDLHNDVLQPEHLKLSLRHRTLVEKINNLLTKRATARIALNESQDRFKMATAKTEEFESDMAKLQQENEMYRKEFQVEKQALLGALEKARSLFVTKAEESQNLVKECKNLEDNATEVTSFREAREQTLHGIEIEVQQQMRLEEQLQATQKKEESRSQKITHTSVHIKEQHGVTQEEIQKRKNTTSCLTERFLCEVEHIADHVKALAAIKKSLCKDLKREQDSKSMHQLSVTGIQENVATSKYTLQFQAEEGARLEDDNQELEFRLTKVLENHQVTVHLCKDKMRKLQDNISQEKKAGGSAEELYWDAQSKFCSQESKLDHTMSLLASFMEATSLQCDTMSQMLSTLESHFCTLEERELHVRQELPAAKSDLESFTNHLQHNTEALQGENFQLQKDIMERTNILQVLKPNVAVLESEHREKSTLYETQKKTMIALKNKRSGLTEKASRWQKQLEHMVEPQNKLRLTILRQRTYTRQKLREQMKEVEMIEQQVVLAHQQLTAVDKENTRIQQMMCSIEHDCEYLETLLGSVESVEERLTSELRTTQDMLKLQWFENQQMEKESAEHDKCLLENLVSLIEQSKEMEGVTSHAHSELEEKVQDFCCSLTAMERK